VKIDKKLNLVSTINRDGALPVYLHVLPFPYEVVEEHCFLLGNLFNNFITQIGGIGAARVAAMMLRKKLKEQGASEGRGSLMKCKGWHLSFITTAAHGRSFRLIPH
jgi:hypothetical protein